MRLTRYPLQAAVLAPSLLLLLMPPAGRILPGKAFLGAADCLAQEEADTTRQQIDADLRQREQELERIRRDLEAKRREAESLAGQEHDVAGEIERITEELRANQELLRKLAQKKEVLIKDMAYTQQELLAAQASLADSRGVLNKRLRSIYKFGRGQIWEVILMASTFADLSERIYYLSLIANQDRELMAVFADRVRTKRILVEHIETKKARLDAVEAEVRAETRNLQYKKEERDALVAKLKDKRYYYENLARELEQASRSLEQLLGELEAQRAEVSYRGGGFAGRAGRLAWPCEGQVVSTFGVETHPRFGTIIKNNGIDIRALPGAAARAVAPGLVSYAGALAGFGNCVVISHGDGFYTLYGHLESYVARTGYDVVEGDAVGYVGETSTPEGAVLHFEIRQGKKALDPEAWLLKPR